LRGLGNLRRPLGMGRRGGEQDEDGDGAIHWSATDLSTAMRNGGIGPVPERDYRRRERYPRAGRPAARNAACASAML
jgi:hypothetical protein